MVKTRNNAEADDGSADEFLSLYPCRTRRHHKLEQKANGYESDDSGPGHYRPSRRRVVCAADSTDDEEECLPRGRHRSSRRYREDRMRDDEVPSRHSKCNVEHRNDDMMNGAIRRSTRQRKLMYETFNQNLIDKHVQILGEVAMNDQELQRPKRKIQVLEDQDQQEDIMDMYTRVKRQRKQVKRDMYGVPESKSESSSARRTRRGSEEDRENDESTEGTMTEGEEEEQPQGKQYFLREHRPRVNLYEAPPIERVKKQKPKSIFGRDSSPCSIRRSTRNVYMSPVHRSPRFRKKRAAFNRSSSTSSSSSTEDSSEEERRFERRKNKSMARSRNRCLPMNLTSEDMSKGALRDREKIGSSLADVDPMSIDRSVTFESVGGLGKHIRSLKEMVVFPLLYPEVFERFKIAPPRGVLFYGPPGTGKTLVARALANECSHGDRRVAFFMRKGADCLSKWVGESERQLRLLFDKAYQMRPSIIFFDEIDGLAPVRSSRQDQIHSSIVSTLLALMDGLDNRGEIVVIGATNRLDSIDPALRRPGRFDREFLFPLPTVEARRQILQIHTKQWNPKPSDAFLSELAEKCVGYCGADLKALCTEAALHALRRRYPQIYTSAEKLQLDVQSINVSSRDFHRGMQNLVPTAQRSVVSPGRALSRSIKTLLEAQLKQALQILQQTFPPALASLSSLDAPVSDSSNAVAATEADLDLYSDDDDTGPSIYENPQGQGQKKLNVNPAAPQQPYLTFASSATERPWTHRPKLLIAGKQHQGQSSHLAPAVLHSLENMPVHRLDLPSLYAVSSSTPEESCAQVFREARRTSPSIIYVPHLGQLWDVIGETVRATFTTLLQDLEPGCPILLLATSEIPIVALPDELCSLFDPGSGEVMVMRNPTEEERRECFRDLLMNQATKAPASRKQAAQRILENLPLAAPVPPRALTEREKSKLYEQEEATLRELRIFLRDVLNKLGRDRKFTIFWKPVDEEEVPDYYDIIKNPMDLSTMMSRIDLHKYMTPKQFLTDIDLICSNALEYNPDRDPSDRTIRHRACALRDTAHSIFTAEMDPEFEKLTQEILEARERRGETGSSSAPSYYFVKPRERPKPSEVHLDGYPTRYSRRVRGMDVDLEEAKETLQHSQEVEPQQAQETHQPILRTVTKYVWLGSKKKTKKNISPWCKKRRKPRKLVIQIDEDGNEILPEWYKNYLQQEAGESREKEGESMEESGEEETHLEEEGKEGLESDGRTTETEPELSPPNAASRWSLRSKGPNSEEATPKQEPLDGDESPSFIRRNSPRSTKSVYRKPVIDHESEQSISEKTSNQTPNTDKVPESTGKVPESHESECRSPRQTEAQEVSHSQGPPETPVTTKRVARLGGGEPDLEFLEAQPKEDQPTSQSCSTEETGTEPDKMIEEGAGQENQSPQQENQPCDPEPDSPVKPRVTRSQTKSVQTQRAIQILEEEPAVLIIDRSRLSQLLEKTVAATDGFTVEKIEKLYSSMTQCVYQHRQNFDKTKLVQDLEECLRRQLVR